MVGGAVRVPGAAISPGARLVLSMDGREEGGGEWAEVMDRRGEDIADILVKVFPD